MKANDKFKELKIKMVMKLRGITREAAGSERQATLDGLGETLVAA